MKRFTNSLLALVLCGAWGVAQAQAPAAQTGTAPAKKDFTACFAAWDKDMHTLQTDFTQTTEYDGVQISRSQGRIYYRQAGTLLRLDNLDGGQITQSALTDKKQIYVLDEKGKLVTQVAWQEWLSGQPNQALFDFGRYTALLARHRTEEFARLGGQVVLRLTPKTQPAEYILYVALNEKTCFPQAITVQADLMKTTALLTDPVLNAGLKKDLFKELNK